MQSEILVRRIRGALAVMMVGLLLSGLTAFPIQWGLNLIVTQMLGVPAGATPASYQGIVAWLVTVRNGITSMYAEFPWIAYGTDWLAFAHIILALLFIGPFREPVRNQWVLDFGVIACLGVLPVALLCGPLRGIPLTWRLVDCSFGVFGLIPILLARHWTLRLARLNPG